MGLPNGRPKPDTGLRHAHRGGPLGRAMHGLRRRAIFRPRLHESFELEVGSGPEILTYDVRFSDGST
ncbi:MAG: hypothetical protein CMF66_01305, partial [Magnetovibrio sp.]|nr:hypothetical protein [Magnetovibrio sp.]